MAEFESPQLPLGWLWCKLPPLLPNDSGEYAVTIKATSTTPGVQYVSEALSFNLDRDTEDEIIQLFQAVCDRICLHVVEVHSRPVQSKVDTLRTIYQQFEGGE